MSAIAGIVSGKPAHELRRIVEALTGTFTDLVSQTDDWLFRFGMPLERVLKPLKLLPQTTRVRIYDRGVRLLRGFATPRSMNPIDRILFLLYQYFSNKRGILRWYGTSLSEDEIPSLFSRAVPQIGWQSTAHMYRSMYARYRNDSMYERTVYACLKVGIGINALTNYESAATLYSMRMHTPYIDQQLLEFGQSISYSVKAKGGSGTYIPRELCRQIVSAECADQRQSSFILPVDTWLRGALWPVVEETLSRRSIENRGIFHYDRVAELCNRFKAGERRPHWVDIWALVILELWFRLYCDPRTEELSRPSHNWLLDPLTERRDAQSTA